MILLLCSTFAPFQFNRITMSNPKQMNCNKSPTSATRNFSTDVLDDDDSSFEMSSEESVPKQTSSVQHTNLPIHSMLGASAPHTITHSRLDSQSTNSHHYMTFPLSSGSNFGKSTYIGLITKLSCYHLI